MSRAGKRENTKGTSAIFPCISSRGHRLWSNFFIYLLSSPWRQLNDSPRGMTKITTDVVVNRLIETRSEYVSPRSILLPQSPQCWDHNCAPTWSSICRFVSFAVLGTEPMASDMVGQHSVTEPHSLLFLFEPGSHPITQPGLEFSM